jgi:hypothetical protein
MEQLNIENQEDWLAHELLEGNKLYRFLQRFHFASSNLAQPWATVLSSTITKGTIDDVAELRALKKPNKNTKIPEDFESSIYIYNGLPLYPTEETEEGKRLNHHHLSCEQFSLYFPPSPSTPWYDTPATMSILSSRTSSYWANVQNKDWSSYTFTRLNSIRINKLTIDQGTFLVELEKELNSNTVLGEVIWTTEALQAAKWARSVSWVAPQYSWIARKYHEYQYTQYMLSKGADLTSSIKYTKHGKVYSRSVSRAYLMKSVLQSALLARNSVLYGDVRKFQRFLVDAIWLTYRELPNDTQPFDQLFEHMDNLSFIPHPLYDENGILRELFIHNSLTMNSDSYGWQVNWFTFEPSATTIFSRFDLSLSSVMDLLPTFRPLKMRRRMAFSLLTPYISYSNDTCSLEDTSLAGLGELKVRGIVKNAVGIEFAKRDSRDFSLGRMDMIKSIFDAECVGITDAQRLRDTCIRVREEFRRALVKYRKSSKKVRKSMKFNGLPINYFCLEADEVAWINEQFRARCEAIDDQLMLSAMYNDMR